MSVSVAQLSKFQFNWNDAPIVGGLLFTYASGTTTKLTTYQDSFGAVPNTNPIVLDANGQCNLYLTDGLSYKFVVSPPGDTDPPTNPYWTADNITGSSFSSSSLATDLASTTDPTKGTALVGGAARVVASIAALRTLPKTGSPEVFVTGYYTQGDGGGGAYWYDSTDTTSTDNGGTVIVASDGGRWKLAAQAMLNVRQIGAKGDNITDDSSALQEAFSNTLAVDWRIPTGQYKYATTLSSDLSGAVPDIGVPSTRLWVSGAGMPNTILNYSGTGTAISLLGGTGGGIRGYDVYKDFTLQQGSYTPGSTTGIALLSKAYYKLENIAALYFGTGADIDSCYTGEIENCYFQNNSNGMVFNASGSYLGATNEIKVSRCVIQNNSLQGIQANSVGSAIEFDSVAIEQCGTQGNTATGGALLNLGAYGFSGPLIFKNCYFEGNAGQADLYINNSQASAMVLLIGCIFNRVSSSSYTNYNIVIRNSGAGVKTKLILIGCSFNSVSPYTPDAARPFITGDANTEVIDLGCYYSENTSRPGPLGGGPTHGRTTGGSFDDTGTAIAMPGQLSVVNTATGVYTVTHNSGFGKDANSYFVNAISTNNAAAIHVERVINATYNSFQIVCSTIATGTLANCPCMFTVTEFG